MRIAVLGMVLWLSAAGLSVAQDAHADSRQWINIPAQQLGDALRALGRERGIQIVYRSDVVGTIRSQGAVGELTSDEAIQVLLKGTGLTYHYLDEHTVTIVPLATSGSGAHSDSLPSEQERASKVTGDSTTPENSKQDSTGDEPISLEEVIVTAERRAEPLKEVPMSATALAGATLDKLQDTSFADYASLVPGLALQSLGPGVTRLILRGQNAGGAGSTVGVYVDDSPFGSSTSLLNGSVLTGDFDPWDLERVEVLRGPQGTFYGANSEGGLLKFVTRAPVLGQYSAAGEMTGESLAYGQDGWSAHGVVNLPLGDAAAFRASGFGEGIPGYINDPLTNSRDVNRGSKYGARASVLLVPAEGLSVRLTAVYQNTRTNGTSLVDINPVTLQPVHGDLTQERYLAEPRTFTYQNYNATLDWAFGPMRLVSSSSYGVLDSNQESDDTSLSEGSVTLGEVDSTRLHVPGPLGISADAPQTLDKFTQEIRLASRTSEPLEWQFGGYYTRESGVLGELLSAVALPSAASSGLPVLESDALSSTYTEWAGFGDLTYHFNSQFDIQGGARWSTNQQTGSEHETAFFSGTTSFDTRSQGDVVTYSLAPRWLVNGNTVTYARVATGWRPGGPNLLPVDAPAGVPKAYDADNTRNYEAGVRSTQINGTLSIDVAAFYVDWNKIQLVEVVDNTGVNGNGGTARSRGLEWTFGYVPVQRLTFTWIGAYTDAELTSPDSVINGNSGNPLPYVPKVTSSLDGEYQHPVFGDYKGFIGGNWSYVGSRSTDFASSPTRGQMELPSYNTFAARIGLENRSYRVEIYGKNLGDSRGITQYFAGNAPGSAGELGVIRPRLVGVSLSARY